MKTYIKIQRIPIVVLLALLFSTCTERYEDLNKNNGLVTEDIVDVDLLLTRVQVYAIHLGAADGQESLAIWSGWNARTDINTFGGGDAPGTWNAYYDNYGRNLSDIIRICTESNPVNLVNKIAIARIMKVWVTSIVTDTYGDIPYSESFKPREEAILQPKYDTQESIYLDLFNELKEAADQLDETKTKPEENYGTSDLIYDGDVAMWRKLANSLRLRLAMRLRYINKDLAIANMNDLTEDDLITSGEDDAYINTATDLLEHMNDFYVQLSNFGYPFVEHGLGKTVVDIMIGNGDKFNPDDPRLPLFADTAYASWPGTPGYDTIENFGYRGAPVLGLVPVEEKYPWGSRTVSSYSALVHAPVVERPLMRSSEVYFLLAEAALFGLKSGDAEELYIKGMDEALAWGQKFYANTKDQISGDLLKMFYSQSIPEWDATWEPAYYADKEITQTEIDAFKASAAYSLTGTQEEQFEQIINEKIIAMWPLENEMWAELRRTGYPRVLVGHDQDILQGVTPRRMPWPQIEQTVNSASYQEALERFDQVDDRLSKIWWDKNPDAPHEHPGEVPTMPHPWVQVQ